MVKHEYATPEQKAIMEAAPELTDALRTLIHGLALHCLDQYNRDDNEPMKHKTLWNALEEPIGLLRKLKVPGVAKWYKDE